MLLIDWPMSICMLLPTAGRSVGITEIRWNYTGVAQTFSRYVLRLSQPGAHACFATY